jgi:hypothetical protein
MLDGAVTQALSGHVMDNLHIAATDCGLDVPTEYFTKAVTVLSRQDFVRFALRANAQKNGLDTTPRNTVLVPFATAHFKCASINASVRCSASIVAFSS